MKRIILIAVIGIFLYACNGGSSNDTSHNETTEEEESDPNAEKIPTPGGEPADYDPNRGAGKFTLVDLGDKLNVAMSTNGEKVYTSKCSGCHKLTDEKLVGPGWKGVSNRNKPEWLMNFMTNTDEMLGKDPKLKEQLEICLVRMPNQSISDDDARHLLEFMRKNDGAK